MRDVRACQTKVSAELIERARRAVGQEDMSISDLLRLGLVTLAGEDDLAEWTPKRGWPEGKPRGPRHKPKIGAA